MCPVDGQCKSHKVNQLDVLRIVVNLLSSSSSPLLVLVLLHPPEATADDVPVLVAPVAAARDNVSTFD